MSSRRLNFFMLASIIIESIRLVRPVIFITPADFFGKGDHTVVYEVYDSPVVIIVTPLTEAGTGFCQTTAAL